jgi:hypothetical protein
MGKMRWMGGRKEPPPPAVDSFIHSVLRIQSRQLAGEKTGRRLKFKGKRNVGKTGRIDGGFGANWMDGIQGGKPIQRWKPQKVRLVRMREGDWRLSLISSSQFPNFGCAKFTAKAATFSRSLSFLP